MPHRTRGPTRRTTPQKPAQAAVAAPARDAAAKVDAPLVVGAMRKLTNGQPLNREERSALKRHEKIKEEKLRWQYYASIPQKHWRQMSGRQTKVINEQADRYDLPFGGPFINLPKLVRAFHDFLADNALKLSKEDDPLMQGGGSSPALEEYRKERAALARLDRLERETQLLPRDAAREALGQVAGIIRGAGDTLQRQFGTAAVDILYEALGDAEREIERSFGDQKGSSGDQNGGSKPDGDDQHDHEQA